MPDHPLFARFYDRMIARTERAGLGEMRQRLLSRPPAGCSSSARAPAATSSTTPDAVTELVLASRTPTWRAAARAARARGHPGRKPIRDRGARRGPSLRRRQLRRRRGHARPLHGREPGPRHRGGAAGAGRGRPLSLPGARAEREAGARPLAGLAGEALGMDGGRLPSEPRRRTSCSPAPASGSTASSATSSPRPRRSFAPSSGAWRSGRAASAATSGGCGTFRQRRRGSQRRRREPLTAAMKAGPAGGPLERPWRFGVAMDPQSSASLENGNLSSYPAYCREMRQLSARRRAGLPSLPQLHSLNPAQPAPRSSPPTRTRPARARATPP